MGLVAYHGGKALRCGWIVDRLAGLEAAEVYVEPFAGAASVFFELRRRDLAAGRRRTYVLNDANGELVNCLRQLRDRPGRLRALLAATPYSRREWRIAWLPAAGLSALERARRFLIRAEQSVSGWIESRIHGWGISPNRGEGRSTKDAARSFAKSPDRLGALAELIRGVHLECGGFLPVIRRWDGRGAMFYADPPYVDCEADYPCPFHCDDHRRLAEALAGCRGRAAVSYYPHELVRGLYPRSRWTWLTRSVPVTCQVVTGGDLRQRATEALIVRRT